LSFLTDDGSSLRLRANEIDSIVDILSWPSTKRNKILAAT